MRILQLLYTFAPIALAGVLNMIWVRLPVLNSLKFPIDGGRLLSDGRRVFGDNKTWKGFWGMPLLTALSAAIFSYLSLNIPVFHGLSLYPYYDLHLPFPSLIVGGVWGLAYVLAELPNSFLKRRIGIGSGENADGTLGVVFVVVDQADSVLGCMLATTLFFRTSWMDILSIVCLASLIHLAINFGLYLVGLKNQPA